MQKNQRIAGAGLQTARMREEDRIIVRKKKGEDPLRPWCVREKGLIGGQTIP